MKENSWWLEKRWTVDLNSWNIQATTWHRDSSTILSSYEHSPVCDIFERQIPAWSRACCANRNEISAKNERETPTNVPALIINCGSSDWRTVNRHLFRASESSMFLALEAVCVSNRMLQRSWTMHWPVLAESHQGILLPAERQGCYQRSSCNVETLTMERFSGTSGSIIIWDQGPRDS